MAPLNATPEPNMFPKSHLAALAAGFTSFTHVAVATSTNTVLADQARAGDRSSAVLVADHQTAGRGRLDRTWKDESGRQLLVSFRLSIGRKSPTLVVSAVGLAAHVAAQQMLTTTVKMKWPNDLVVLDGPVPGKLSGLLAELVNSSPATVVVGVGLNVMPIDVAGATSLTESGSSSNRDDVLAAMLEAFAAFRDNEKLISDELGARSATIGSRVRVERAGRDLVGEAVEIDEWGRLLVDDGEEVHKISAGDIVHLRPAP